MARSIEQVNSYIVSNLVTGFAAIGITIDPLLWSKRNMLRVLCYSVAIVQVTLEQLQDLFKQEVEAVVAVAFFGSSKWVQDKMFKFQYSATDPQVVQLVDLVPVYPVIDPSLRIITACSVTSDISNTVTIKVAKENPFVALTSGERDAAQSYIDIAGVEGIDYNVVSLEADKIFIEADIYYQGQYSAVIQANVIAGINSFFQNLSITDFDGTLKMSDLEDSIRNMTGVNDVVLKNVRGRADAVLFAAGIDLILNTAVLIRKWGTVAGYIVPETDTGHTLTDSLNFIPE